MLQQKSSKNIIENNNMAFARIISPGMQPTNDAAKTFKIPKDIRNLILMEKLGITQEDLDKIKHSYAFGAKPKRLQAKPT